MKRAMKRASYLSRLVQGAGDRPALMPPRMLFRPFAPTAEPEFTEIEPAPPPMQGAVPAAKFNARPTITPAPVKGAASALDNAPAPATTVETGSVENGSVGPRSVGPGPDVTPTPGQNLNARLDTKPGPVSSLNARPDIAWAKPQSLTAPADLTAAPLKSLTTPADVTRVPGKNAGPDSIQIQPPSKSPYAVPDSRVSAASPKAGPAVSRVPAKNSDVAPESSRVPAKSSNAGWNLLRASAQTPTAASEIALVPVSVPTIVTPRSNLSAEMVPPAGRGPLSNKVAAAGSANQSAGSQPPAGDRPIRRPAPGLPFREAADRRAAPPELSAPAPRTPQVAVSRERLETIGQAKTASDRQAIDARAASNPAPAAVSPEQGPQGRHSVSRPELGPQPVTDRGPEVPPVLVPPPPSGGYTSANRPENPKDPPGDRGPAVRIGTLKVRISPPPAPVVQKPVAARPAVPRLTTSLARGFGSFGLVQA